jgi:hypothetical protein
MIASTYVAIRFPRTGSRAKICVESDKVYDRDLLPNYNVGMGFISIAHNLKLGFLCYKENFSEDGGLHRGIGFCRWTFRV